MLPTDPNPHLVPEPEGFQIGDMISIRRTNFNIGKSKTVEEIVTIQQVLYYKNKPNEISRLVVKALRGKNKNSFEIHPIATVLYRPEDITQISDETLDERIARLHGANYIPVEAKKRKAKASSARAITKKGSIADTTRKAIKTGQVKVSDLDDLVAMMERIKRGEVVE
jgi:hypothetical protein